MYIILDPSGALVSQEQDLRTAVAMAEHHRLLGQAGPFTLRTIYTQTERNSS